MISISQILLDIKEGTIVNEVEPGIFHATSASSEYVIVYDINKCIGAASCAAIAPLTFFMNDENRAEIKVSNDENVGEIDILPDGHKYSKNNVFDSDDVILEGAMSCPVLAIEIYHKESGQRIFPAE